MIDAAMSSSSIEHAMLTLGENARHASRAMMRANSAAKNKALLAMADALAASHDELKAANEQDVAAARANGLEPALLDRLTLSDKTLAHMAEGLRQIAALPDPIGSITATTVRPNGMRVAQMRVPLGVIGIIYESRPNVTIDAAALCLKSGNAAILRGGSEALHSNIALGRVVQTGLAAAGLPQDAVQVVATADRAAVGKLITMTEHIDVIVPRGGKGLIARLSQEARHCLQRQDLSLRHLRRHGNPAGRRRGRRFHPAHTGRGLHRAWRRTAGLPAHACPAAAHHAGHRRRLGHGIPGPHPGRAHRRYAGRRHRTHRALGFRPH
ncbi:hypothetical protein G6F68_011412 [Rhizopus microsporus]|nr:hypothetical protein G6F68_011412 [Rhizopus microsporus]